MHRRFASLTLLILPIALAACLSSPEIPGSSAFPVGSTSSLDLPHETGLPSGGGILLHSNVAGSWCTCDDPLPVPVVRQGAGLAFRWTVADPVAVDRFAEFRLSVDGEVAEDWGSARSWPPAPNGQNTLWFPEAGLHTLTLEKDLFGASSVLVAQLEVVAP